MTKVVTARYDASHNTLRLVEPLEGVKDDETLTVTVETTPDPERPWLALSGSMSAEQADDFERAIKEMFPPWNEGD
ncbi:MAG TPA: hypothetical protein VKB93_17005 [Thermoanaerobaculia bacterium]|nr:hypothetical protein [Thermoanaerobaculia bacterium]